MNRTGEELLKKIKQTEDEKQASVQKSPYRAAFHLMPPVGWLNDPNGLCQFEGVYHLFFQYAPFDVDGGMKAWGHYTSRDMISLQYEGAPFVPDESYDKDGVYSGSAWTEDGKMYLYYTGNVKEAGEHDYIHSGRGANVVFVSSEDGLHFSEKKLLLTNADYPENCTNHVRDPKIYKENGKYYMVLGARLDGGEGEDRGAILLYSSENLTEFIYEKTETTDTPFGYMWECPDVFCLDGKRVLSISPQGVEAEEYRYQNIYQSGYFSGNVPYDTEKFTEWDMGFDFYAPQTFEDESGRRILVAWAGVPDAEYKSRMPGDEWQHMMTIPRELRRKDDKVLQYPVKELEKYRGEKASVSAGEKISLPEFQMDILLEEKENEKITGNVFIGSECVLECKEDEISLSFTGRSGAGRTIRRAKTEGVRKLRILIDVSIVEIFVNDGELSFTTRIFSEEKDRFVKPDVKADFIAYYPIRMK